VTEPLKLGQTQLAYAIAIREIEMHLGEGCPEHHDDDDPVKDAARAIVHKLERLGNLNEREFQGWRYKVPLDDLYTFSDEEKNLLLDLHDAGGIYRSRTYDKRFNNLGGGSGVSKGAVSLSAGGPDPAWKVQITERGKALVAKWLETGE
jgi:hypothetical protein